MQILRIGCLTALMSLASATAIAFPQLLAEWVGHYGGISTSADQANCQLCHANPNGGSPWNGYGWDMILAFDQPGCDADNSGSVSSIEAFHCVEFFNSDNDTGENDNLTEISQSTQPGWSLGDCNDHYSSVATIPGQTAPDGIGTLDPDGTAPLTGCDTDPTDPTDPGDATIVTVHAGESIQAAIDAVAPGSTLLIEPGVYHETGNSQNGLNISKGIRLIGMVDVGAEGPDETGVVIEKAGDQRNGIVVVPSNRTDCLGCHVTLAPPFTLFEGVPANGDTTPAIHGIEIRNITIRGFINNGLFTERVDDFKIINVHSVDNRNYGIFPTLSSNGLIQHSSATGADDSGIWVETSTNVLVTDNLVEGNVNGFEVSNSDYITLSNNVATNNTVGMSLFVLTDLVDERPGANKLLVENNWIYDNNKANTATPGTILSILPTGFGILMLAVDNSIVRDNLIEDNNSVGIALADYCLGVLGTSFDCSANPPPPEYDPLPERNQIIGNTLVNNGTDPDPGPFAGLAADLTFFVLADAGNCILDNEFSTVFAFLPIPDCRTAPLISLGPVTDPGDSLRRGGRTQPVFRPLP